MAKIFKISGYFVDPNGDYDAASLAVTIRQTPDIIDRYVEVEEVNLPEEWDDDHPLNRCDCPVAECEKYFTEAEPVDEISVDEMRERLEGMCNARECYSTAVNRLDCPLLEHNCTCNFLKTHPQPMSDQEIRDAYKIVFNRKEK